MNFPYVNVNDLPPISLRENNTDALLCLHKPTVFHATGETNFMH